METTLKNIFLAGIGSIAYTYEKAVAMTDDLVRKGELTISQGKELNEELKRRMGGKQTSRTGEVLTAVKLKEILSELNLATREDLEQLTLRINALENQHNQS